MPATPDQMPIAIARSRGSVKTLVMIERVAGMMSAAPRPITARAPTSSFTPPENAAAVGRDAEDREAHGERALPAEAVTERTEGEQEPGEHERVRVDHPLEVGDAGAEVSLEGGKRDVDDRVVDHDDQQAHAQHGEGEPPAVVRPLRRRRRGAPGDAPSGGGGSPGLGCDQRFHELEPPVPRCDTLL